MRERRRNPRVDERHRRLPPALQALDRFPRRQLLQGSMSKTLNCRFLLKGFWELTILTHHLQDRLWELVDEQWMECLQKESVENLLGIPSGLVQVLISSQLIPKL